jgi:hypothetical protein
MCWAYKKNRLDPTLSLLALEIIASHTYVSSKYKRDSKKNQNINTKLPYYQQKQHTLVRSLLYIENEARLLGLYIMQWKLILVIRIIIC